MSTLSRKTHKQKTYDAGLSAEDAAVTHIQAMGAEIIGNRIRNNQGEIDVVSVLNGIISFIEVKRRKHFSDALSAVSSASWARISRTAEVFMSTRPDLEGLDWRYDLIVQNEAGEIDQVLDAWRPDFA